MTGLTSRSFLLLAISPILLNLPGPGFLFLTISLIMRASTTSLCMITTAFVAVGQKCTQAANCVLSCGSQCYFWPV